MPTHPPPADLSPLADLAPEHQEEAIVALWGMARDAGLSIPATCKPIAWARALGAYPFAFLSVALQAHIVDPGNRGWLQTPADLVRHLPARPDPDLAAWEAVERASKRARPHRDLAPEFSVRQLLALLDCGTLVFDLANAEHPIRRRELRDRFLAACKTPRPGIPPEVLASPALPYRENILRAHSRRFLAERAPLLLSVEE